MATSKPQLVKTDDYPERPLKDALADPAELLKTEAISETDQIADYHEKNPTLKVDAPESEPKAKKDS